MRLWIAAALLLALGVASACSVPNAWEAASMLGDLAGGPDGSPRQAPTPVSYGRERRGDLYLPNDATAAVVLVPGAARTGKDDPRLVAVAHTLARARFAVLVPDIASLRDLNVGPENVADIADAADFLAERHQSVGLVAVSYAVGPAVLAALERPDVGFVVGIGGYYDLDAVVTFFTTGYVREGGAWHRREPNAYGKWVFVRANAKRLWDSGDRALLAAMAERKMADPAAAIDDLMARLGPEGRSVHALLANGEPERVPALIAALPERIRTDMAALDLRRRDLSTLKARLILVHGRDDAIIPFGESRALAAAAPSADLYALDRLAHAELAPGGVADGFVLWRAVVRLLNVRDAPVTRKTASPNAPESG